MRRTVRNIRPDRAKRAQDKCELVAHQALAAWAESPPEAFIYGTPDCRRATHLRWRARRLHQLARLIELVRDEHAEQARRELDS